MCIIRFHACAGYLQTYETFLREINAHPGSAYVPDADDPYRVECLALADRNTNFPCESGIHYSSLTAMLTCCGEFRCEISIILHVLSNSASIYFVCTMYIQ